jgi:hypothetical protein
LSVNRVGGNALADEMVVSVDVLGVGVIDRVFGKEKSTVVLEG